MFALCQKRTCSSQPSVGIVRRLRGDRTTDNLETTASGTQLGASKLHVEPGGGFEIIDRIILDNRNSHLK
jgi:hypothetical protein